VSKNNTGSLPLRGILPVITRMELSRAHTSAKAADVAIFPLPIPRKSPPIRHA